MRRISRRGILAARKTFRARATRFLSGPVHAPAFRRVAVVLVPREDRETVAALAEHERLRAHARDVRGSRECRPRAEVEARDAACRPDQLRALEARKSAVARRRIGHYSVRHFQADQFAVGLERPSVIRSFSRRSIASFAVPAGRQATAEHPDWMSIVPVSIQASPTLYCGKSQERPGSPTVRAANCGPRSELSSVSAVGRPRMTDCDVQPAKTGNQLFASDTRSIGQDASRRGTSASPASSPSGTCCRC